MGGVKDRYLKYVSAGEQYVGHYTNFADQNSAQFAVSPPHFNFSSFEMADCIACRKYLDKFISGHIYQLTDNDDYGYVKYPDKLLFASLCHHHKYLAENFHPQILLIPSSFSCNVPYCIREYVKISYP